MELSLAQIEHATKARLQGTGRPDDGRAITRQASISGWSIDSRTVVSGDLFIAIRGEHFDGHEYVKPALERGALAALVERVPEPLTGPVLVVANTLEALQSLARAAREKWQKPIVAVTGSAGKTSTKDIIAALLGARFRVGKTVGNFNNHIGLPLSLLRIPDSAEAVVLEMGMNHAGEIRELAKIARPQIAVVTNVGYAHIEAFESVEGIAAAKRELVEELPEGGVAVLNADDQRVAAFRGIHKGKTLTYGTSEGADLRATAVRSGPAGSEFKVQGLRFETKLSGPHSISNILAALAVADLFGIPLETLASSVRELEPGKMRGERYVSRGVTIWNDAYNSNPEAARSMIDVLKSEPAERRIAVLGEMLELGAWADRLHRELGGYVVSSGIDVLIGIRGAGSSMVDQARESGMGADAALFFEDPDAAGDFLRDFVQPGDAILFKGSRGTQVERALARMDS